MSEVSARPRKLELSDWAKLEYGEKIPHINTLRKWARDGRITPPPVKNGKTWYVVPEARYQGG